MVWSRTLSSIGWERLLVEVGESKFAGATEQKRLADDPALLPAKKGPYSAPQVKAPSLSPAVAVRWSEYVSSELPT